MTNQSVFLDSDQIKALLPHRPPLLLVDSFRYDPPTAGEASLFLTEEQPILAGHFPDRPLMPGVMIIEHTAQAAGLLLRKIAEATTATESLGNTEGFLVAVKDFKFIKPIVPPALLFSQVVLIRSVWDMAVVSSKTYVNKTLISKGEISIYHGGK